MGLRRGNQTPALVVPDGETWLVRGEPATADRFELTSEVGRARVLVTPDRVPGAIADAVTAAWRAMPPGKSVVTYDAGLSGVDAHDLLRPMREERHDNSHGHDEHGSHDEDRGHEDHDHGDMMAITGEPSADGLVMETLDVQAGPLGGALAGGLTVNAKLDGDVVAECDVRSTLEADGGKSPADYATALAWTIAEASAGGRTLAAPGDRWLRLVAVELERATAHIAWLHAFSRLLGWAHMSTRARRLLAGFRALRSTLPRAPTTRALADASLPDLLRAIHTAAARATAIAGELEASRSFEQRTAGLGGLTAEQAMGRGVTGPVARASGLGMDARAADDGYASLGFEPLMRSEGDARARALLRAGETAQSLELAAAALEKARQARTPAPGFGVPPVGVVESARGPVRVTLVDDQPVRTTPGADAVRSVAGELAVGREWASALVAVASFDVSPWRVEP